ncbi:MAG TPA: hypothetical protein VL128_07695 [Candidatus Eisenbacteria bacterium]|nr:hypothetical protein [Candidatus Eisenbacteria bacterium]
MLPRLPEVPYFNLFQGLGLSRQMQDVVCPAGQDAAAYGKLLKASAGKVHNNAVKKNGLPSKP